MRVIITWLHGEDVVLLRRYDDSGKLVGEETYKGVRLLDIRTPVTIPSTLMSGVSVYIVAGDARAEKKNSILVVRS